MRLKRKGAKKMQETITTENYDEHVAVKSFLSLLISEIKNLKNNDEDGKRLLTVAEVEKILSLKRTKIYDMVAKRQIPYIKFSNKIMFDKNDIEKFIKDKIVNRLIELGNAVNVTYGYLTKPIRIALKLGKSHINDAFVIAGGDKQEKLNCSYFIKFVRKCNRSLFKANLLPTGIRKRNTIKQAFGFQRFDKVLHCGIECFIYGLRTSGYFDVRLLTGEKINASVKYTNLKLIERFKTLRIALLPALTDGVFEL